MKAFYAIFRISGMLISLLLLFAGAAMAQESYQMDTVVNYRVEVQMPDSIPGIDYIIEKPKKVKIPREPRDLFTGTGFYVDYGKAASFFMDFESKYEAGLSLTFWEDLRLSSEFGSMQLKPSNPSGIDSYLSRGRYVRLGPEYILPIDPANAVFVGLRYAFSQFDEKMTFYEGNPYLSNYPLGFERKNQQAQWGELVMGSEGKVRENLMLGFILRIRVMGKLSNAGAVNEPPGIAIPGYGKTIDNSIPALNLFIRYHIPFKSKKNVLPVEEIDEEEEAEEVEEEEEIEGDDENENGLI